jgi:hypothetical protein
VKKTIKVLLTAALAFTFWTTALCAPKRDFQPGKLVSVTQDEKLIKGSSYRWAVFTVKVGDLIYTARGGRVRPRSGDVGKGLIIGDAVQVALEGDDHLVILKPDGKELKMKIIQRERTR